MFSIVIPLFNKEKYIKATLETVFTQTFQDFEIIVVDDGSTDGSMEIVEAFGDKRIKIFRQENKGVSVARNKGIEMASMKYICFLDADDVWRPFFLEKMYELINVYPSYQVFSAAIEMDTGNRTLPALYSLSKEVFGNVYIENYFKGSMRFSLLFTSCAIFHRSVFQIVGGFDEEIRSGQDIDMWIRIGEHFPIVFLNEILCKYIFDNQSLSRDKRYFGLKLRNEKFIKLEQTNSDAKRYLDWVRYSEAIKNKLLRNTENVCLLKSMIDRKNLTLKQKILLEMPSFVLKFLMEIQPIMIKLKLRRTVFK